MLGGESLLFLKDCLSSHPNVEESCRCEYLAKGKRPLKPYKEDRSSIAAVVGAILVVFSDVNSHHSSLLHTLGLFRHW